MAKMGNPFKDLFKMNSSYDDDYDDEYYDEDYDDDYDEEEETQPTSRFERDRKKSPKKNATQNYNDYDEEEEKPSRFSRKPSSRQNSSNVVSMNSKRNYKAEIITFKPTNIEDSREIVDALLNKKAIVLNFEGTSGDLAQRILDNMSGACCAVDGSIKKVSSYIFIIVPNSIGLEGDYSDDMSTNNTYGFRNRYQ